MQQMDVNMQKGAAVNRRRRLQLNTFGLKKTFGDIVLRCMPKYNTGGPHGTPFVTILGIYVNTKIPNIEKFQIYEVYRSREVSHH